MGNIIIGVKISHHLKLYEREPWSNLKNFYDTNISTKKSYISIFISSFEWVNYQPH